jgi:hypothetical protein
VYKLVYLDGTLQCDVCYGGAPNRDLYGPSRVLFCTHLHMPVIGLGGKVLVNQKPISS